MQKTEAVIQLTRELLRLEDQARMVQSQIEHVRNKIANLVDGTVETSNENGNQSLPARIIDLLGSHPKKEFTAQEVSEVLGVESRNFVSATLSRLARAERIKNVSWGKYQTGGG